jgi:DNA-binding NarL/FixJ family response regulator
MGDENFPRLADAGGDCFLYDIGMINVFLADTQSEERSALRLLVTELHMNVVGEAVDWSSTLLKAPRISFDLLLVDWTLLPENPQVALAELRAACPNTVSVVLFSHLDSREQAANSVGADLFISKGEAPERVAEFIKTEARNIRQRKSLDKYATRARKEK